MAVTSIHPIKSNVGEAIYYIVNPEKTDGRVLTEYFCCSDSPFEAAKMFDITRRLGSGKSKILAQHIIQSFAPGEVSKQEAFEIGKELADRLLQGEYQYVLATHIDHKHIHNHIIFCNTSQRNFKTFETNENTGRYSFKTLREVSDMLCAEHNLSVITPDKNAEKGLGYFENTQGLEGKSWKQKLKILINALVFQSENFEDFLAKCRSAGISIEYKPQNKIRLKYRLSGMQKWARARTLGQPYDVEGIAERIAKYKVFYNGENLKIKRIKLIDTDQERFQDNEYLKLWARLKNTKTIAELLLIAEQKGCKTLSELNTKIELKKAERKEVIEKRNTVKNEISEFELIMKYVKAYHKYKPFRTERERLKGEIFGAKKSAKYAEEHADELRKFNEALEALNGYDFKNEDRSKSNLPDLKLVEARIGRLKNTLLERENNVKNVSEQIKELSAIRNAFEEYLHTGERSGSHKLEIETRGDDEGER